MTLRKTARRLAATGVLGLAASLAVVVPATPAQAGYHGPGWENYGTYDTRAECLEAGSNVSAASLCELSPYTGTWDLFVYDPH